MFQFRQSENTACWFRMPFVRGSFRPCADKLETIVHGFAHKSRHIEGLHYQIASAFPLRVPTLSMRLQHQKYLCHNSAPEELLIVLCNHWSFVPFDCTRIPKRKPK